MGERRTTRTLAVLATGFAAVAVALLASAWLFNASPQGASCYTDAGYASIKSHAETRVSLATGALLCTAASALICVAGIVRAAGHRLAFALSLVPLFALGWIGLAALIISAMYCQN